MRRLSSIAIALLLLTVVPTLAMAGPPTQLYGKSVSFRWLDEVDFTDADGQHGNFVRSNEVGSYISTRGRIFTRSGSTLIRGINFGRRRGSKLLEMRGVGVSRDPEGDEIRVHARYRGTGEFKGHTLTVTTVFDSGARRITVNFDERFHACTVDVVFGKERGVPGIIQHAPFYPSRPTFGGGTLLRLQTHTVSDQKCTITDGNIFGTESE
jgi:hypothetical protein